ncbi:MAG: TlyA family RNA methyltransferase [Coriobacteriales bacterium]|jgi:23S rRNA (cytidine1920-2'-O)/16S rRNA (cytidine1409-2'-O)-methyltransferase|nr:TlyA family RNA methyltransferase [Coriobacteriales bacterium]
MKHREQLKNLLVARGFAQTSNEAERLILAARVSVNGALATQAGELVAADALLEVSESKKYVSRGGLKLEGALDDFAFDPAGLRCLDAGASSGGFTDCLLKRGATQVVAVDVGYGQFDWQLRQDSRVALFERTNIARVSPESLGGSFDLLVADLSFTSLAKLAGPLAAFVHEEGNCLTLVKPQFELPKDLVSKGVVNRSDLHIQALQRVGEAYQKQGLVLRQMSFSHLLGPKGNVEFWIWAAKCGPTATIDVEEVVTRAHKELLCK